MIFLLTVNGPTNSNFYGAGSTDLLVTWLYLTVTKIDYNLASVIGILIFIYMQKFIYYRKKKVEFFTFLFLF
ncbi:TPA: sugar ABC transporter permease, partial [Enterococcus faecium]|nr:sugar ABC transporter permease [Enterococcus faecium]HCD3142775.1 sugar ABC transporter permease [Enterococcus faecium]